MHTYKGVICRGSYALGSACGSCEKCADERRKMNQEALNYVAPTHREEFFNRISAELDRAYAKHGREQWGRHEFYGIIKEEFDEMWADIKSDAPQGVLEKEIIQVAAMCFRYFETRDRYREPVKA